MTEQSVRERVKEEQDAWGIVARAFRGFLHWLKRQGALTDSEESSIQKKLNQVSDFLQEKRLQTQKMNELEYPSLRLRDVLTEIADDRPIVLYDVLECESLRDSMKQIRGHWYEVITTVEKAIKEMRIEGLMQEDELRRITKQLDTLDSSIKWIERKLHAYVQKNSWW